MAASIYSRLHQQRQLLTSMRQIMSLIQQHPGAGA